MIDFRRMNELIRKEDHMKMAIARERAKAERITSALSQDGGGGGGRGTSSRVEDGAIALTILQEEYKPIAEELEAQRKELKRYLRRLDELQRTCMRMRYIRGLSCTRVAEATFYSKDHIYHTLKAAENRILEMQANEPRGNDHSTLRQKF